jgi:nickel/cobalt exporter
VRHSWCLAILLGALGAAAAVPTVAAAHPLGNFTVNRYSRIEPAGDGVRVFYVLDMAEIPTVQERTRMDADGDGRISDAEVEQAAARLADEVGGMLRLTLNGRPASLRVERRALTFPPGQADLPTLRLEVVYRAGLPAGATGPIDLVYRDENSPSRIGWHEVVARPGAPGTELRDASVPATDASDELRAYPNDLLTSPLDVREARLTFVPGLAPGRAAAPSGGVVQRVNDAYTALAAARDLSPTVIALSLLVAAALGAVHALSPGHGKTIVAAYLVGSNGTARHAAFLGATVTATHTAGVFALGLVTLSLSELILPERLYPFLEAGSGLLVVGLGAGLFVSRTRAALAGRRAHYHHGHEHHGHAHADHGHHALDHVHEDAHHGHPHAPPSGGVSLRSLLALGVSGGLLPCPTALVVLLGAIALGRVAFGVLLVVAFSIGLATVLVGLGLALVYARRLFERVDVGAGPLWRLVPVASALVITLAGVAITAQALPQAL